MIGWQRDEDHWPAGGNAVASSRGNKIKEKKRVAWRETNQSYENKNQLYGQKSQIQQPTDNPLQYEQNQKRKMTSYSCTYPKIQTRTCIDYYKGTGGNKIEDELLKIERELVWKKKKKKTVSQSERISGGWERT